MPQTHREQKIEEGRIYFRHHIQNDPTIESSQALRDAQLLRRGDKVKAGPDGAELIWAFQIDPDEWMFFRRDHPDLVSALQSADQIAREQASATIARMHPEWVASSPRIFQGAQSNGR